MKKQLGLGRRQSGGDRHRTAQAPLPYERNPSPLFNIPRRSQRS